MPVSIFVHAGLHKTGTSSIQVELTRARHILKKRGFLYPESCIPEWAPYGHHELAWMLADTEGAIPDDAAAFRNFSSEQKNERWNNLIDEIEGAALPNVILSSEEFDILDGRGISRLGERLSKYNVVPVLFLRNLSDFVESGYGTAIAHSNVKVDIATFAKDQRSRSDFARMLGDWQKIATDDRMIVASYDDPHLRSDVVLTFLRLIGLDAEAIEPDRLPFQNESLPAFAIEIIRSLRRAGVPDHDEKKWRDFFLRFDWTPRARRGYTLLSTQLRNELDNQYIAELDLISADKILASKVFGSLLLNNAKERILIENLDGALNAFGTECGSSIR